MGLIEGFEYDIFISYAHDDNLGHLVNEPAEGWVLDFAKMLKKGLSIQLKREIERTGRSLEIFWDKSRLQHGEPLDWELNDHVEKSAIFCIFMSQNYLDSNWCRQELDWFLKTLDRRKDRLNREHSGRLWPIIIVSVSPTSQRDWPDEVLRRGMPFDFYDKNEHARDPRHAYPSIAVTPDPSFYEVFTSLETTLSRRVKKALAGGEDGVSALEAIQEPDVHPYEEAAAGGAPKRVLVVTTDDLAKKASRLEASLKERGIELLRADPDPDVFAGSGLGGARAAVFMLGVYPGPDDEARADLFRAAAAVADQEGATLLPWMQKPLKPSLIDEDFTRYKEFVTDIEPSLLSGSLDDLLARIDGIFGEAGSEAETSPPRLLKLFIDAAKIDIDIARQIQEKLRTHDIRARTYLPQVGADQKRHNEQWNTIVEKCDGVILVYGRIDVDAIDDKLDQIWRLSAKRRANKRSDISVAILDAPPPSGFDVNEPGIKVITAYDDTYFSGIEEFIASLAQQGDSEAKA